MADSKPPVNAFKVVAHLPDTQYPYGASCQLDRVIQCVFFYYRLRQDEANLFAKEGFTDIVMLSEADPDGSGEQRKLYVDCLETQIVGHLWRHLTRKAVRCLLSGNAFVDIAVDIPPLPPAKKLKTTDGGPPAKKLKTTDGGCAFASAPSTSSSSSSSSSGVKRKVASGTKAEASNVDEDGDDDFSDYDSDSIDFGCYGRIPKVCFVGVQSCAAYLFIALPGMHLAYALMLLPYLQRMCNICI